MARGGETVGKTVRRSRQREGHGLPSSTATDLARGSRSRLGPVGALCGTGALRLPQIQILWHRVIPFFCMGDWRALPVFCGLSERWQRMLKIVYSVSERCPLRRKFIKTASALMHGIQDTKVRSTPVPLHTTVKDLCARVARPSGKMSRIAVREAIAASKKPAARVVATRLASSSFQADSSSRHQIRNTSPGSPPLLLQPCPRRRLLPPRPRSLSSLNNAWVPSNRNLRELMSVTCQSQLTRPETHTAMSVMYQ